MIATATRPVNAMPTISEEQWNNMYSLQELDDALKAVIHNHFHQQAV